MADLQAIFMDAVAQQQGGNLAEAEKSYRIILQHDPRNVGVLNNFSIIAEKQGRYSEASEACKKIINIQPDFADAHNRLGLINVKQGNYPEAIEHYKQALRFKRTHNILFNISIPYYMTKQHESAENALTESLQLRPGNAAAHMNLALVYFDQKKLAKAEEHAMHAVKLDPESADANHNLGMILCATKNNERAIPYLEKAVEINPLHHSAPALLMNEYQWSCDWDGVSRLQSVMEKQRLSQPPGKKPPLIPFMQISLEDDQQKALEVAAAYSKEIEQIAATQKGNIVFDFSNRDKDKKKLTLGYLSFDYAEHPIAHITKYFFSAHNRERFRVIAYATSPDDNSEIRKKYEKDADKFVDISDKSDLEAAKMIYDDQVDILFDLTCHTKGSRLGIASMRPAPINVNMWGFPGTTGSSFMDYIIVDKTVVPEESEKYYTEKLVYMPDSLNINHNQERISDKNFTKSQFGLPEDGFVFCSFNAPYKIEPVIYKIWMEILQEVESSVLWLRKPTPLAEKNLKERAEKYGIKNERIIFAGKIENRDEYYRRIQLADLALDTRIYNGGTTTMDALWAGVPVITAPGKHFAARMSAGIMKAVSMPELIAANIDQYKEMAIHLAKNPEELQKIRDRLWKIRSGSAFYDTKRFVDNLSEAIEIMWKIFAVGEKPRKIAG